MSQLYADLNLTEFPDNLDQFLIYLNITASDGPIVQQYMEAMNNDNQTQANQILATLPSASQKIIKATDLNHLTQAMLALERFYKTDIEPYVTEKQGQWTDYINQFEYIGVWSSGTSYERNNMVTYTVGGITMVYLALSAPPVGTPPTNTTYWRLLTIQGIQGVSGVGLSYRQEWDNAEIYYENDAATYDGALWQCLQQNQGQQPAIGSAYWQRIMSLGATAYPIQDTQPTAQDPGELWFNTQVNPTQYTYLEPLGNPASGANIQAGYEAYDANGNLLTGTLS